MSLYASTTRVPVIQSRAEIERLLERHKARKYGIAIDEDTVSARVQFTLHNRIVRFIIGLPDPKKLGGGLRYEQAQRQKWRALLLVIKAKLEAVENSISTFEEEFLAHIVMPNDKTVAQIILPQIADSYKTGKMPKQLTSGEVAQS